MADRRLAGFLLAVLLTAGLAPAASAEDAAAPCSRGLVALTFDDGPKAGVTPALLDVLTERHVPATFFVVGERVAATPAITRRASDLGFTIGNHTYRHENLTRLSDSAIERTLRRTRRAIVAAGAHPSGLMRPPYGSINARVRSVVAGLDLVPVLWTVDPRDWAGGSAEAIADATTSALRPHARNVVILHDGVANSPNTLVAVPRIIRRARLAGYCFAGLDAHGRPRPPVPHVRIGDAVVTEGAPGQTTTATVAVTLDRPTSRATSVRVVSRGDTATEGKDFARIDRVLRFPAGTVRRTVSVRVLGDALDEPTERLSLLLSAPSGLRVADGTGTVRIRDDDPPPEVRAADAQVTEPATGDVVVPVIIRLSRPSGRQVVLHVATEPGTADALDYVPLDEDVTIPAGAARARVPVTVLADVLDEPTETFGVTITRSSNADVRKATATVTIVPPQ